LLFSFIDGLVPKMRWLIAISIWCMRIVDVIALVK